LSPGVFVRLSPENSDYLSQDKLVGVFVKGLGDRDRHHAGFVFAYEEADPQSGASIFQETRQLDFIDDNRIVFGKFKPGGQWLHATIDFATAQSRTAFAAYLTAVALMHAEGSNILYGMTWQGLAKCFDDQGVYTPQDIDGLTCATFMCEIVGLQFDYPVDFDSWPFAEDQDIAWAQAKLHKLREKAMSQDSAMTMERVDAMESRKDWKRLRPAQAAAAIAKGDGKWQMAHVDANALAEQVIADFYAAFPPPPSKPAATPTPTPAPAP